MSFKSINVQMTEEHFERSIKGTPRDAIKELIWNACDADAKKIDISFKYDGLAGEENISEIFVKDDGHGIPFDKVEEFFGNYGRSQKTYSDKSPAGRVYHGKYGQGRYKSLALGNFVEWETTFLDKNKILSTYVIQITSGSRMDVKYSNDVVNDNGNSTGTVVHIQGIPEEKLPQISKLEDTTEIVPELLSTFAPYLLAHPEITIVYNGVELKPEKQIEIKSEKELLFENEDKTCIKAKAVFIKWKQSHYNKLYICDSTGVVYEEKDNTLLNRIETSIYLMSDYFEQLHKQNILTLGGANPVFAYFEDEAKKYIKELLTKQAAQEASDEIGKIKEEGVYPYKGEPEDEINRAERNVFDVLAVEVNKAVPQLRTAKSETKKLTYHLIKEAINTNPTSIKTILTEVFNLSKEQQDELAELLTHTHLTEIIDVAKTVSDRLQFIYVLEQMVYNDSIGKPIKERSQFHKILLKELWIFGEKYTIGTSDQSLKNVLIEHIKSLGRDELIPNIPAEAVNDLNRIPDICLFKQICPGYQQYENLVIELKRPTKTLTKTEIDQIEDYAFKVSDNPLFDKTSTKWHFILLGQDFNKYVESRLNNRTEGAGNLYNSTDGSYSISVFKWATIIQENKFKYEFLRQKLNYELQSDSDFAVDYLLRKHNELFPEKKKA